jgi:transposase-like protein
VTPTGLELLRRSLREVVAWLLEVGGFRRTAQRSRNELIRLRYAAGETISELARAFGISPQRVYQIVNFKAR